MGWRHASRHAWAIRDASFRIEPGERVLLLGASGSGKSTLLHGLAGVLGGEDDGEHTGSLLIDGEPAAAARGRAGLVLQDPDAQVILARVGDDVAFGCENLGIARGDIWARVSQALDAVGLDVPLDRATKALSGGQKQRLALAGLLAMRPGLVLLDEPTANLDPVGVTEVRDAVIRMLDAHPATLVVVEHRVAVWLPVVSRVIVLGDIGGIDRTDGAADLDGILAVEEASFTNPWTRAMYEWELQNRSVCHILVVRTTERRVAGFCSFWLVVDEIHINNVAILPEYRARGFGTRLMRRVLTEGLRLGAVRTTLEVRASNEPARRFYEALGFRVTAARKRYYTNPVEDALILWREPNGGSAESRADGVPETGD